MLGLVLEGGANRTYYSVGILDAFIDNNIKVDYVIGASAGIANGVSYISWQKGRTLELGKRYIRDKRYMGLKYMFQKNNQSYYNRNFVFNELPNKELPFDYDAFSQYPGKACAVVTNIITGKPEYLILDDTDKNWIILQATCALPVLFKPISYKGSLYMDGGCTDPLPVKHAVEYGCDKIITILTRERSYIKKTEADVSFSTWMYRKHQAFAKALVERSSVYNESRRYLFELEKENKAFVFAPSDTTGWKRTEKEPSKLEAMYNEGYKDALQSMDKLKGFIHS